MNREWKRNPAVTVFYGGLLMLVAVVVVFVGIFAHGTAEVPTWLAMMLSILSAGGMFLLAWGVAD